MSKTCSSINNKEEEKRVVLSLLVLTRNDSNAFYNNVNTSCDFYIHFLMNSFHGFQNNITDFLFLRSSECTHYFYELSSLKFPRDKNCIHQNLGHCKKVVYYTEHNQVLLPAQTLVLHAVNLLLPSESS